MAERLAPTQTGDYLAVALGGVVHAASLSSVAVILANRRYPPFITKSVPLVSVIEIGSALWFAGLVMSYGSFDRSSNLWFEQCVGYYFLQWVGLSLFCNGPALRVYRSYQVFYRRNSNMYSIPTQLGIASIPFLAPPLFRLAGGDNVRFSEATMTCMSTPWMTLALNAYILLGMVLPCTLMMLRLRNVRKQFNEYNALRTLAVLSVLMIPLFPVINIVVVAQDPYIGRLAIYAFNIVSSQVIYWITVLRPMRALLTKDEAYLYQFTHGFSTIPTPAMLRESMEDQLTLPQLREQLEKFAARRQAAENVAFYRLVLQRDETEDYFQRMALTLTIIDTHVRPGSPEAINLPDSIAKAVMNGDPDDPELFDDARREILTVLETNFARDFKQSEEFKQLQEEAEKEQSELAALDKLDMKPKQAMNMEEFRKSSTSSLRRLGRSTKSSDSATPVVSMSSDRVVPGVPDVPDVPDA